jgi:hypothetical protein
MITSKIGIVYTVLVFLGILLSSLFALLLQFSPFIFIIIMILYVLAISIYVFVIIVEKNKLIGKEIEFDIAGYIMLFNMLFMVCIFIMAIIFRNNIIKKPVPVNQW